MANHALVIGCDRYWDEASDLRGAVRDAQAVRQWLLDPERGAVPRQNLTLLLGPAGEEIAVTRAAIVSAIETVLRRADGDDGTLYFYFAGHGLTATADGYDEPCLLPGDFQPNYREPALPVRAVVEQFATSSLATQFLIVDACRGVPAGRAFRAAGLSDRRPRDYGRREPDQYTLVATSAGDVAYETESGEFTGSLLRGLRGAGSAKRWDAVSGRYAVRIRELFDYVRADLAGSGVAQAPRLGGSHNEPNPVLAHVPEDAVGTATLTVTVTPADAADRTTVTAYGASPDDDRTTRPPLPNPLALRLRPCTYTLRVTAPGFAPGRGQLTVDLYDDAALEIELERAALQHGSMGFQARPGFTPVSADKGSTVVGPDPSALLEAVDETGNVLLGAGELRLTRAGRYRLRVVEPHETGPDLIAEVADRSPVAYRPTPPSAPGARRRTLAPATPAGPAEVVVTGLLDRPLHVAAYAPGAVLIDGGHVLHLPADPAQRPQVERAQRFVAAGRLAEAKAVLAADGLTDPVGVALRGLLAARDGVAAAEEVATAAATLRRAAPDLPDTAVLTALARTFSGPRARPVPPDLAAPPVLALGLTAALRLYRGADLEPPGFMTRAAETRLPDQALTVWG